MNQAKRQKYARSANYTPSKGRIILRFELVQIPNVADPRTLDGHIHQANKYGNREVMTRIGSFVLRKGIERRTGENLAGFVSRVDQKLHGDHLPFVKEFIKVQVKPVLEHRKCNNTVWMACFVIQQNGTREFLFGRWEWFQDWVRFAFKQEAIRHHRRISARTARRKAAKAARKK